MKVIVSDRADADLAQIYRHLLEQNPAGAESVVREIDRKVPKFRRLSVYRPRRFLREFEASWRIPM